MMLMMPDLNKKVQHNSEAPDVNINEPVEEFRHNEGHVGAGVDEEGFNVIGVLRLRCQEAHQYPTNHS